MDFFNWNGSSILIQHDVWWLLLAFAIGCWVGLRYNNWVPRS